MSDLMEPITDARARQRAIQARCVHPSNTFVEFPREAIERSIPERFEQQVRRHPDRLAVQSWRQALTYAELDRAANRISRAVLAQRGEGSEPIALLFEHDAPMVAALLGVLKAGKFYVPLDTSHPPARTAYVLEDSQAGLLVTNSRHLPQAQAVARKGCQLLNVDELTSGPGRGAERMSTPQCG
jgi:non-ribosomal peptide synthetase component F